MTYIYKRPRTREHDQQIWNGMLNKKLKAENGSVRVYPLSSKFFPIGSDYFTGSKSLSVCLSVLANQLSASPKLYVNNLPPILIETVSFKHFVFAMKSRKSFCRKRVNVLFTCLFLVSSVLLGKTEKRNIIHYSKKQVVKVSPGNLHPLCPLQPPHALCPCTLTPLHPFTSCALAPLATLCPCTLVPIAPPGQRMLGSLN